MFEWESSEGFDLCESASPTRYIQIPLSKDLPKSPACFNYTRSSASFVGAAPSRRGASSKGATGRLVLIVPPAPSPPMCPSNVLSILSLYLYLSSFVVPVDGGYFCFKTWEQCEGDRTTVGVIRDSRVRFSNPIYCERAASLAESPKTTLFGRWNLWRAIQKCWLSTLDAEGNCVLWREAARWGDWKLWSDGLESCSCFQLTQNRSIVHFHCSDASGEAIESTTRFDLYELKHLNIKDTPSNGNTGCDWLKKKAAIVFCVLCRSNGDLNAIFRLSFGLIFGGCCRKKA